jgi:hypothetical protein
VVVAAAPTGPLPPNTFTMDLLMANATIPTAETSYLCTHFNLNLTSKFHITAYEVRLCCVLQLRAMVLMRPFHLSHVGTCTRNHSGRYQEPAGPSHHPVRVHGPPAFHGRRQRLH